MRRFLVIISILAAFSLQGNNAVAQEAAQATADPSSTDGTQAKPALVAPELLILKKIEEELKAKYKTEIYIPPSIPSLIFTPAQQSLLREARNGFNTRIPTEEELKAEVNLDEEMEDVDLQNTGRVQSVRNLSLSGIVFANPDDWTIWLNKKRITPNLMPTEVVDLRVYKVFIELKWFDIQTNQIYPVRLRPNQTFNLDARIFVPG